MSQNIFHGRESSWNTFFFREFEVRKIVKNFSLRESQKGKKQKEIFFGKFFCFSFYWKKVQSFFFQGCFFTKAILSLELTNLA